MRAEAARLKKEENDRRAEELAAQNAEMKSKIATAGPAIDAALDDNVNALREAKRQQSEADFAREEQERRAKQAELNTIKNQTSSRTDHSLS